MMNPVRALIAILFLIGASVTNAQVEPKFDGRNLDPETRRQVEAIINAARLAGLPVEPIIQRALEGSEKTRDGALIIGQVGKMSGFIAAANDALKPATDAEISAGAHVLTAGLTPATLARLRKEQPRAELTVSLGVLADLVARGVPRDVAADIVVTLARSGARDTDLRQFRQTVDNDIAIGISPEAAATTRANAIMETRDGALPVKNRGPTGTTRPIPPERP